MDATINIVNTTPTAAPAARNPFISHLKLVFPLFVYTTIFTLYKISPALNPSEPSELWLSFMVGCLLSFLMIIFIADWDLQRHGRLRSSVLVPMLFTDIPLAVVLPTDPELILGGGVEDFGQAEYTQKALYALGLYGVIHALAYSMLSRHELPLERLGWLGRVAALISALTLSVAMVFEGMSACLGSNSLGDDVRPAGGQVSGPPPPHGANDSERKPLISMV